VNAGGEGRDGPARPAGAAGFDRVAAGFDRIWEQLRPIGRDPQTGGYRRFAYDDAELTLRDWFADAATSRGLAVHEDRAGNLWAWWGDPDAGRAVVTGSHLDSVPQGGAYDGPLGVIGGLLAIDELRARGVVPARPIAVVAFADEEGGRFGVACAGSRLLTGRLEPERALSLRDETGHTLRQALERTGRPAGRLGADPRLVAAVGAFVELHVEQGRGLIDLAAPVAVGTAIRPHGRWRLELLGRADHAGTTLLADREDPMLAQARLVLAARSAAEATAAGGVPAAVATVGRLLVEPNGVNAIPSRVLAWLDVRSETEAEVRDMVRRIADEVGVEPREESWSPRVELSESLADRLAGVVARRFGTAPRLATGAGHDAGILALAGVPTAMLHVRNPTGVSHAPDEYAHRDDCVAGVLALTDVLADLARHGPSAPGPTGPGTADHDHDHAAPGPAGRGTADHDRGGDLAGPGSPSASGDGPGPDGSDPVRP
jgi:beta-ureidopropionase / N-carbamoyl-L-amino-acid hydrolase